MHFEEIRLTFWLIRDEVLTWLACGTPTLDDVDCMCRIASRKTFITLPPEMQKRINRSMWDRMVENTVKKIILENL